MLEQRCSFAFLLFSQEMVIDKVNGQNIPRYLVYDIMMIEGKAVGKQPFYKDRLQCIGAEITGKTFCDICFLRGLC